MELLRMVPALVARASSRRAATPRSRAPLHRRTGSFAPAVDEADYAAALAEAEAELETARLGQVKNTKRSSAPRVCGFLK